MRYRYNLPNDPNSYVSDIAPEIAINVVEIPDVSPEQIAKAQKEIAKADVLSKYEFHTNNGIQAYNDFRADLVVDLYTGLIATELDAILIGNHLIDVYGWIQKGDWKSALHNFNDLTESMPIEFDAYKGKVLQIITDYVANNYEN